MEGDDGGDVGCGVVLGIDHDAGIAEE